MVSFQAPGSTHSGLAASRGAAQRGFQDILRSQVWLLIIDRARWCGLGHPSATCCWDVTNGNEGQREVSVPSLLNLDISATAVDNQR